MKKIKLIDFHLHQSEAYACITTEKAKSTGKVTGRIVIPTGGGKTLIQAAVIDLMQTNRPIGFTRIHLVLAPRILLTNQLIEEYRKFNGVKYRAIAFHSGSHEADYEEIDWQEKATTMVSVVIQEYENAQISGTDLVVFSTYHSSDKLAGIAFDTLIADESQYCVTENFNDAVRSLDWKLGLFFTATERHTASDKGRGLNNESVFGPVLYKITPAELIMRGLIVAPRLHIMYGNTKDESKSILNEVTEIALEQDKLTIPKLGFSKILFAMKGTEDVKTISDNLARLRSSFPKHNVFTITSKIGAQVDGVKVHREQFLDKLKKSTNALIFHYDILSEGIDVDGITGVVIMRNLGLAKLLQTIGRAIRIYKLNPALKEQAWISIPVVNGDEDSKEQVRAVVVALRMGGFDISAELVHETTMRHSPKPDEMDDAYIQPKLNLSIFTFTDVLHEIEQNEFWDKIGEVDDIDEKIDLLFG